MLTKVHLKMSSLPLLSRTSVLDGNQNRSAAREEQMQKWISAVVTWTIK